MGIEGPFSKPAVSSETREKDADDFVVTPLHAINAIRMAMQWIASTGAGDSEMSQLKNWCEQVEKGELPPKEALKKTQELTGGRQDYH